jgi:hypothetical protein
MKLTSRTRTAAAGAASAALALAVAAPAGAATVDVDGGATQLRIAPGTARALHSLGVRVSTLDPAKAGRRGVSFPVRRSSATCGSRSRPGARTR